MINHDQAIFDAIAAATDHNDDGIFVDVQKFINTFNNHRDRKLCTSLDVAHPSWERLTSVIRPMIESVCSDRNSNAARLAKEVADALIAAGISGFAQKPSDPLAGLVERLDRLCLTSTEDGRRFVLATESAKNIVGIVREWLRTSPAQAPPDQFMDDYKRDTTNAMAARIRELEAALREIDNMAPATCEVTLAHQMADIASAALAPEQAQVPDISAADCVASRGFEDGVLVGREMPGVAKPSSDSEALALLIEGSDGLAMMRHEGPVQLGVRKTAMVITALRGIAQ